jgi:hypothetical protein
MTPGKGMRAGMGSETSIRVVVKTFGGEFGVREEEMKRGKRFS